MKSSARKLASANGHASSPARSKLGTRQSPSSLQAASLADSLGGNQDDLQSHFSLAHELAAAMMPEPSSASKLLAEELGLDFEEEDVDEDPADANTSVAQDHEASLATPSDPSFQSDIEIFSHEENAHSHSHSHSHSRSDSPSQPINIDYIEDIHSVRAPSPQHNPISRQLFTAPASTVLDPLEQLARELAETDEFITTLRRLDTDPHTASTTFPTAIPPEPPVERYTSRMIRKLNDTVRERESQLRELVSIEKEFRRIEGEIGGKEVLGALEPLNDEDGLFDDSPNVEETTTGDGFLDPLRQILEEEEDDEQMEETDRDDEDIEEENIYDPFTTLSSPTYARISASRALDIPSSPARPQLVTPSSTIPHLAHMREVTTSLVRSLSTMSEHAQENGAGTADAGRRIKALKNRMSGLQSDWESAERSRARIEEWESEPLRANRVDGRVIVQQQLDGFAKALADAAIKTQAILAR